MVTCVVPVLCAKLVSGCKPGVACQIDFGILVHCADLAHCFTCQDACHLLTFCNFQLLDLFDLRDLSFVPICVVSVLWEPPSCFDWCERDTEGAERLRIKIGQFLPA